MFKNKKDSHCSLDKQLAKVCPITPGCLFPFSTPIASSVTKAPPAVPTVLSTMKAVSQCPGIGTTCWTSSLGLTPRTRTGWDAQSDTHAHTLHTVSQMAQLTCLFARLFSQSDTPYRRSFTVLDNIGQSRTGRASVAAGQYSLFNLSKKENKNYKNIQSCRKIFKSYCNLVTFSIFMEFLKNHLCLCKISFSNP